MVLPYTEILAYCLMPNHFHWLVVTKESACEWLDFGQKDQRATMFQPRQRLNHQINILLRSYTRAVNKQENRSGSLFRQHTKAKDGWIDEFIGDLKKDGKTLDYRFMPGNDFATQCFFYIHDNPVKANLVKGSADWNYSSARDYAGLRGGTLCNQNLAREILGLL